MFYSCFFATNKCFVNFFNVLDHLIVNTIFLNLCTICSGVLQFIYINIDDPNHCSEVFPILTQILKSLFIHGIRVGG